jgi:cyclopropane fatty-acyl-phospholipid synthase-like methyltransferase
MERNPISREEVLVRLCHLHGMSERATELLRADTITREAATELRQLIPQLKRAIRTEYLRMSSISLQERMGPEELGFYLPAIQEAWTDAGLHLFHAEKRTPRKDWQKMIEAVHAKIGHYLRALHNKP